MRDVIYKKILYNANVLSKGISLSRMYSAFVVDRLSREELYEVQSSNLRAFMRYAFQFCKYYNSSFKEYSVDLSAQDIFSELKKLPPLNKSEIKANIAALISEEFNNSRHLIRKATGGSTGEPLCVWGDKEDYRQNATTIARQRRWINVVGGMRTVTLFGGFRDMPSRFNRLAKRFLLNDRIINVMDRRNANYYELLEKIRICSPEVIIGYFSSLRELAYAAEDVGCPLSGIKVILACAEPIDEVGRSHAEKWLGAKIYFQYGNRELGTFAQECVEQEGYHYAQDQAYCETLDEDGCPADYGNLTITYFGNKVVPLIRYQTGDGASLNTDLCKCGLQYHRISVIDGRISSMIKLKGGKIITSNIFTHIIKDYLWIKEYQIVQESIDKIRIIIRHDGNVKPNTNEITNKIHGLLGSDYELHYEFNSEFEQVPTGKHVNFITHI